jgi:hemoglobin
LLRRGWGSWHLRCTNASVKAGPSRRSWRTSSPDALRTIGIDAKFARSDIPRLKKMLVDQVTQAAGGPVTYSGRDMKETHAGMGVTAGEFDALVEDLVASLDRLAVPKEDQGELLGLLAPMRGEIVEIESPATGQPLPETYEPAPALS